MTGPATPAAPDRRRRRPRLRRRLQRAFLRFRPSLGLAVIVAGSFGGVLFACAQLAELVASRYVLKCAGPWRAGSVQMCRTLDDANDRLVQGAEAFFVVAIVCSVFFVARRWRRRERSLR